MKTRQLELTLAAADPVDPERLGGLDLEAMEAELRADLDGEQPASLEPAARPRRRRPRRLALAAGAAALAAIVAVVVLAGGGSQSPSRAYGASLVRFAESSPLLLLDGPGWRVQNVVEERRREGIEGSIEFVTGKPVPYETLYMHRNGTVTGMLPAAVRQRKVELSWRHGSLAEATSIARDMPHPHGQRWITVPVLGARAQVDTRAAGFRNLGRPGDRQMTAYWTENGHLLEMRAAVPDRAAFEARLGWLTKVDLDAWLGAMPAKVVKAADHGAAVREMLEGIPVPRTFSPARIPDEGLTTNRYQVGAKVTGTVSCLWLRQWGEARRSGDRAARLEAERAMATSRQWPILREMAKDGAYPETVWELAAAMPSGVWQWANHTWRLLPHAEGLGCARLGLPLLPRKQQRQRQHGVPPPPN